ncbi:MAG: insulinase family protein [Acidobacteria bacterium]|nr:insulinase family protein [Acidobacteriota bacterium]
MSRGTLSRGRSPVRDALPNGVVTLVQENRTTPAVAINATFRAGSILEPFALPGLAYLTGLVIDHGSLTCPAEKIAEVLDDRGVSLRVGVTRHTFSLACTCLADDFDDVLALVGEIARRPVFPEVEIEKRRAEAITNVGQDADNPAVRAIEGVLDLLYGPEHPYARPAKGTVASLEAMHRADLVAFHARHLVPAALRLAIVGDVEAWHAIDAVPKHFSGWQGPDPEPDVVPPPPPATRKSRRVEMPGKSQADIAYGFTAIRRLDPRYYAYWFMNTILGQFGLGGRLAENIREEQGMAYDAFSSFDGTVGEGPLLIRAGVDPVNVTRALAAIDREVDRMRRDGPTPVEVEETRASLIGSIPRLLETNESIAEFLQLCEQFELGVDYDRRLPSLLQQVTLEEVRAAAAELLDINRASFAVAGP